MSLQQSIVSIYRSVDRFVGGLCGALPTPPIPPWREQLPDVVQCAETLLATLPSPHDANTHVYRYLLLDLLDLLASHGLVRVNPLSAYVDLTGSFDDHARIAWTAFCQYGEQDPVLNKEIMRWARSRYKTREFPLLDDELQLGLFAWRRMPAHVIGPSPVSWDMALPRLMAYLFTDAVWFEAREGDGLDDVYLALDQSFTTGMEPHQAMTVQWKRLRIHGYRHLEQHLANMDHGSCPPYVPARFVWMQTCLYYAFMRGKLNRLSTITASRGVDEANKALDTSLATLITLLTTEVNR